MRANEQPESYISEDTYKSYYICDQDYNSNDCDKYYRDCYLSCGGGSELLVAKATSFQLMQGI